MARRIVALAWLVIATVTLSSCGGSSGSGPAGQKTTATRTSPDVVTAPPIVTRGSPKSGRPSGAGEWARFRAKARALCKRVGPRPTLSAVSTHRERELRAEARWLRRLGDAVARLEPPSGHAAIERYRSAVKYEARLDWLTARAVHAKDGPSAKIGMSENEANRAGESDSGRPPLRLPGCLR